MDRESRDWIAREEDARRLGTGPDNAATTRSLLGAAKDPEPEVRKVALESLGKLAPTKRRVEALLAALHDREWEVRWAAARSLAPAARRSARVRAALERATHDTDPAVAAAAGDALAATPARATRSA